MSLWSRLFGRPVPRVDKGDSENWHVGDLAVCVSDRWAFPHLPHPAVGDVLRVSRIEHVAVDFSPQGRRLIVAATWLSFQDTYLAAFTSTAFRKAEEDSEPCEEEFKTLIKRPARPKVPVRAEEWR